MKRAFDLLDYLIELVRLRSKINRTIDDYKSVLWIHEIPREQKYCFTQAWGNTEESAEDIWVEIKKYPEPILDEIPEICEDWADYSTLHDIKEIPLLRSSINVQKEIPTPDTNQDYTKINDVIAITETLNLADYPEVSQAWDQFVDKKWFPWADLYKRWQHVQNVYTKLFQIYQEQQKLGEEYEFILGLGLLTWRIPSGHSVKRHLITAKATLTFEAKRGIFTVTPAQDGAQLGVELDMLDIAEQPIYAKQIAEGLRSAEDNPWDSTSINPVLNALTNSLPSGQGEFHPESLVISLTDNQTKPIVDLAPALILRKRSARQVEEKLKRMREQIEKGGPIPPLFRDICEIRTGEGNNTNTLAGEIEITTPVGPTTSQTIYFPKSANNEQLKIINKLESFDGILVQGPPGTGKSHTIANLICHFLATGQRVLVTAKTPRALQVLHEKLPDGTRPLCISLLGSGIAERNSIESSVNGILGKLEQWDGNEATIKADDLESSLHRLKSEEAEIKFRVRSIREADTRAQSILNGAYQGTAGKNALQLEKESNEFSWFQDKVCYEQEPPVTFDELMSFCKGLIILTPELEAELQMTIPLPGDLPSKETLQNLFHLYREHKSSHEKTRLLLESPHAQILGSVSLEKVQQIAVSVTAISKIIENIRTLPFAWVCDALRDVLSGNGSRWNDLYMILSKTLSGLKQRAQKFDTHTLTTPDNCDRKKLLLDANIIKKYFDEGGKPRKIILFYPKAIRDRKYIFKNVKMNGCPCDLPESIETLIEYLSTHEDIDYSWKLWEGKVAKTEKSIALQVAEIEELRAALFNTIDLCRPLKATKDIFPPNIIEPVWHNSVALNEFINICGAIIHKDNFVKAENQLKQPLAKIERLSKQPNAHPITGKMLSAIKRGDINVYSELLQTLTEIRTCLNQSRQTKITKKRISEFAPLFTKKLLENPQHDEWESYFRNFERAWTWARAKSWTRDFLNKENLPSLERRLHQIEENKREKLAELSATHAWNFCFKRMTEEHRRHLVAWHANMEDFGKGTGKHAPRYRREAQKHFNKCRETIPAWVMPLHRVYETVDPLPGMFDVIIVDEASQCGLESLPLMYLAKRLIVVGDDQQISPEAIGIDRENVFSLQRKFLNDFDHSDSFNLDNSLFDHARRRFGNRIVLREHFRCVQEIITFSNDLCYSSNPLIPLRQSTPNRLEPLKIVHVPDGYREGADSKVINRREAEEIVKAISRCCKDKRYDKKTFGVISLQGDTQSALIQNMLLEEIGAEEMEKRRLLCGNPYSFQGDERHVIFLSMVAAPNERIGSFSKIEDQRRFNVAASRAQDQMWLFHTATLNDLSDKCLRKRLLEYFENPASQIMKALGEDAEELFRLASTADRQIEKPPAPYESWFEVDVALKIASKGYRVIPQYKVVENKRIDLVIEGNNARLAVECDGDFWHGLDNYEKDMDRQRMLERCGWTFFRIRESSFYANRDEALIKLWEMLKELDIQPIAQQNIQSISDCSDENDQVDEENANDLIRDIQSPQEEVSSPASTDNANPVNNIQDALRMKPEKLRAIICETLKTRPNRSCVKEDFPGFVLKKIGVISRGNPREAFCRKVKRVLNQMIAEGVVSEYKSKNLRIKLQ